MLSRLMILSNHRIAITMFFLLAGGVGVTPAWAVDLTYPIALASPSAELLYIADSKLPGILKLSGEKLEVYYQAQRGFGSVLNGIRCLAVDQDGRLLAGDTATRDIYRFDENGKPVPLTKGKIGMPQGLAVGKEGVIYVSDLETHAIYTVPKEGGDPKELAALKGPLALVVDSDGQLIVVSRQGKLFRVKLDGKVEPFGEGAFQFAQGIAVGPEKTFFVSDSYAGSVVQIMTDGKVEPWVSGDPLKGPVGLATRGDQLLIADPRVPAVFSVAKDRILQKLLPLSTMK